MNHKQAFDLFWYFGKGAAECCRTTVGISETGVLGDGNSGTKGAMVGGKRLDAETFQRNHDNMMRYGGIGRALAKLTDRQRATLELAYGDFGYAVTEGGIYPGRRWRVVAPITRVAVSAAKGWAKTQRAPRKPKKAKRPEDIDERKRDASLGALEARWVSHVLGHKTRSETEEAAVDAMRVEARRLVAEAEEAYGKVAWR